MRSCPHYSTAIKFHNSMCHARKEKKIFHVQYKNIKWGQNVRDMEGGTSIGIVFKFAMNTNPNKLQYSFHQKKTHSYLALLIQAPQ